MANSIAEGTNGSDTAGSAISGSVSFDSDSVATGSVSVITVCGSVSTGSGV